MQAVHAKRLVLNGSADDEGKPAEDWLASCEIAVEATRMPVGTIATYLRGSAQAWWIATGKAAVGNNATFAVCKKMFLERFVKTSGSTWWCRS